MQSSENLIFPMRTPYKCGGPFSSHLSPYGSREAKDRGWSRPGDHLLRWGDRWWGVMKVKGEDKWGFILSVRLFILCFTQQIFIAAHSVPGSPQAVEEIKQALPSRNSEAKTGNHSLSIHFTHFYWVPSTGETAGRKSDKVSSSQTLQASGGGHRY